MLIIQARAVGDKRLQAEAEVASLRGGFRGFSIHYPEHPVLNVHKKILPCINQKKK